MRGVDHHDIDSRFAQRRDPVQGVRRGADGRADAQPAHSVLAGIRKFGGLLKVLYRDHALEFVVACHHQNLLDAVLVQQREHLILGRIFAHRDQAVLRRHDGGNRSVQFGFEAQIPMRDDADDFRAQNHRYPGDVLRAGQLDDLTNRHVRFHGDRVADHAALEFLDAVDLTRLIVDGHVLVDDADTAFLGDGDGQPRLGHGIHRGGYHGEIDLDFAGQLAGQRDIAGQHFRICRHQQNVVECECLFKNTHRVAFTGSSKRRRIVPCACGAVNRYHLRMETAEPASSPARPERDIYSVSRLNREVRVLLERGFGALWLEAEISNFARPSSGHWYFSLKDSAAQVRCAMFRQRNMLCAFTPRDGQKVLVRARIGLYEPRGEYQLIVDHMEDAGLGALKRQFEELSARLNLEGLFAAERKRSLPRLPRRIGIITSPTGAAVRDILHVLARRFPAAAVLIYPVSVQGAQAAAEIVAALESAGVRAECDVLILARGGGSLEDLWAFNDERLARAIVASPIPVITGIGHEIDFTIADFAADVRAPTPSAAAELVVPDAEEWLQRLRTIRRAAAARHAPSSRGAARTPALAYGACGTSEPRRPLGRAGATIGRTRTVAWCARCAAGSRNIENACAG